MPLTEENWAGEIKAFSICAMIKCPAKQRSCNCQTASGAYICRMANLQQRCLLSFLSSAEAPQMEGDLPRHVCSTIHPSSPIHHLFLIRVTGSAGVYPKGRNTPQTPPPQPPQLIFYSEWKHKKKKGAVLRSGVILEAVHFDTHQQRHVSSLAARREEELCSHTWNTEENQDLNVN